MPARFTLTGLVLAFTGFFWVPAPLAVAKADDSTKAIKTGEKWTLMKRVWTFKMISSSFDVVSGRYDAGTNQSIWVLKLNRNLKVGDSGAMKSMALSPFKIIFNDEDGVALKGPDKVKMTGELNGKKGDQVKIIVEMPSKESSKSVKGVRVDRRTEIGF